MRGYGNEDISRKVREKTLQNGNVDNGTGRVKCCVRWETRAEEKRQGRISNNKGLLKKSSTITIAKAS